ncbi:MAG: hypothetical protein HY835_01300, partial [Anaerolineae bacterium]|nr:hypothetical protein [Anaerolineae bacterium]
RLNLQRTQAGLELDAAHLVGLSADSVPAVARAYQDSTYSTADREKLGAVLACHKLYASQQTDWRSFRISESRAQRILAGIDLSRYTSQTENYNEIMLNGEPFYCYYSMHD